jgi:nucleoside-diphosphate-sugar epimerase
MKRAVVSGAGGLIGGHLTPDLLRQKHSVRAVDMKPFEEWYQRLDGAGNLCPDLRLREACERATAGGDLIYNLAAGMGGMGFIDSHRADCIELPLRGRQQSFEDT